MMSSIPCFNSDHFISTVLFISIILLLNVLIFCFTFSTLAFLNKCIVLLFGLLYEGSISESMIIMLWSEMPGTVSHAFTKLELLVMYKSNMLSFLLGLRCNCSNPCSSRISKSSLCCAARVAYDLTMFYSQFMWGRLKSPPIIMCLSFFSRIWLVDSDRCCKLSIVALGGL